MPVDVPEVAISAAEPDSPDALFCLERYFAEIATRFENGFDPGPGGVAADRDMNPPTGLFLVARREGAPVGCAGLKLHAGKVAEIKRMWIAPDVRGFGLALRMVAELEAHARRLGARRLRLDTNRALAEARALYLRAGFAEVPRFNDNPYAHHWYEKAL